MLRRGRAIAGTPAQTSGANATGTSPTARHRSTTSFSIAGAAEPTLRVGTGIIDRQFPRQAARLRMARSLRIPHVGDGEVAEAGTALIIAMRTSARPPARATNRGSRTDRRTGRAGHGLPLGGCGGVFRLSATTAGRGSRWTRRPCRHDHPLDAVAQHRDGDAVPRSS